MTSHIVYQPIVCQFQLWGVEGGLLYRERWGSHGKGVSISDTSTFVKFWEGLILTQIEGTGIEYVLTLMLIVSMKTHTDNPCKVVMYELFVFILINSTPLINIIIR